MKRVSVIPLVAIALFLMTTFAPVVAHAAIDAPCFNNGNCNATGANGPFTCQKPPGKCVCPWGSFEQGIPGLGNSTTTICDYLASTNSPIVTLADRIAILVTGVIIAIGLITIAIGGYVYMTAGGSGERVSAAKTMIFSALLGIVLALSAFAILSLVSTQFTSQVEEPKLR